MADLHAGLEAGRLAAGTGDDAALGVAGLFRARYPEMVRLADLLGADDPEDIAQEAFARLIRTHGTLRNPEAALAYEDGSQPQYRIPFGRRGGGSQRPPRHFGRGWPQRHPVEPPVDGQRRRQ